LHLSVCVLRLLRLLPLLHAGGIGSHVKLPFATTAEPKKGWDRVQRPRGPIRGRVRKRTAFLLRCSTASFGRQILPKTPPPQHGVSSKQASNANSSSKQAMQAAAASKHERLKNGMDVNGNTHDPPSPLMLRNSAPPPPMPPPPHGHHSPDVFGENVTRHTSHVTRHTSHVTRHTSHVTRHTSLVLVTRHMSHVTRHASFEAFELDPDMSMQIQVVAVV